MTIEGRLVCSELVGKQMNRIDITKYLLDLVTSCQSLLRVTGDTVRVVCRNVSALHIKKIGVSVNAFMSLIIRRCVF
jgi:hypothetical protein